MTIPVIVVGGGGYAKVLVEALRAAGADIAGIVDSDPTKFGRTIGGVPVLGDDTALSSYHPDNVRLVNALGSVDVPTRRRELFGRFKKAGYGFASVVHPSAVIAADTLLEEGAQVMAGAVIQPGCRIGRNTIVSTGAIVEHDCSIGDHVHIAPGAVLSGGVRLGECCHIGTGSVIIQQVQVGGESLVAAGAVVTEDVPAKCRVAGVPARKL